MIVTLIAGGIVLACVIAVAGYAEERREHREHLAWCEYLRESRQRRKDDT